MLRKAKQIIAILITVALFSPLITALGGTETADDQGGELVCNTNLQLIPQAGEVGGGNVRWRIRGEAARDLRRALIHSVGDGEGELREEHLQKYLQTSRMLESYLQRGPTLSSYRDSHAYTFQAADFTPQRDIEPDDYIDYHGVEIRRSSLTSSSILDDTVGLVGSTADDTSSIEIKFTISFHETPGTDEFELNLADHRVMTAIFDSIIIPRYDVLIARNATIPDTMEFQLEHSNLLVNDGEVQARAVIFHPDGNRTVMHPDDNIVITSDGSVDASGVALEEGDELIVYYGHGVEWTGRSKLSHWTYVVGTHSYYQPDYDDGTLYVIRTPAGNLLHYSVEYDGYDEPNATIMWKQFNIIENPQLLFVIAAVSAYFTVKFPKNQFKKYRDIYHPSKRSRAEKHGLTHISARIMSILILVFYFIPAMGPLFIGGLYLIIISAGLLVASIFISKFFYSRKAEDIPEEYIKPPKKKSRITPVKTVKRKKPSVKKHTCKFCEETFTIPLEKNLVVVKCPSCGQRQRKLKEGYNYLILEDKGNHVFSIFTDFLEEGLPGLIVTTKIPNKVREKFNLTDVEIQWLTDHDSSEHDVLDPTRLEFDLTRSIANFANDFERGVLLLDGLEYLIVENGFENVSKFLKKSTDTCSVNSTTYLVHLDPSSLSEAELSIISKEFDHVEDLREN